MNLPTRYVTPIKDLIKKAGGNEGYDKSYWSVSENNLVETLTIAQLAAIKKLASKDMSDKVEGSGPVYRAFKELERRAKSLAQMRDTKEGADFDPTKIRFFDLKTLATLLKTAIAKTSNRRWIYVKVKDYLFTPAFVTSIEYYPKSRNRDEHVALTLSALCGKASPRYCVDTIQFYASILGGQSVVELDDDVDDDDDDEEGEGFTKVTKKKVKKGEGTTLDIALDKTGIYLNSKELEDEYAQDFAAFSKLAETCGSQHIAIDETINGLSVSSEHSYRWWSHSELSSLTVDGVPSRLVVDDGDHESYDSNFTSAVGFDFRDVEESVTKAGDFWGIETPVLPTLPVIRCFNMQSNAHCFVAASSIKPYEYDETIWTKLILPKSDMSFIKMLLSSTTVNISDIVQGKAKGIIAMCSGGPGLGKTLTAEASSEAFKKPLYSVQCSQLGIDPEELEKNLMKLLSRASRWEAILLLDEADVYVRRRGLDLSQNAIVGVFLRVLEYYRGIMFMTTNLGKDIDDAILSRCTAHLRYDLPEKNQLPAMWAMLMTQFKVALTPDEITRLVAHYGRLPGRSIRNIAKLTKYMSVSRKEAPSYEMVLEISKYLDVAAEPSVVSK